MKLTIDDNLFALTQSNEIEYANGDEYKIVKVEPLTMKLLEYLLNKKGEVCTSKELIENIWDGNAYVGKASLRKSIYKIRNVLNVSRRNDIILTVPKKGYRLNTTKEPIKKKRNIKNIKILYVIAIIILILIIIKIIFPGVLHRLMH